MRDLLGAIELYEMALRFYERKRSIESRLIMHRCWLKVLAAKERLLDRVEAGTSRWRTTGDGETGEPDGA